MDNLRQFVFLPRRKERNCNDIKTRTGQMIGREDQSKIYCLRKKLFICSVKLTKTNLRIINTYNYVANKRT